MATTTSHDQTPGSDTTEVSGTEGLRAPGGLGLALYVVATPLGNLRDITLRAIDVLGAVDTVAAEDTRTSATLLAAHGIRTRLIAAHDHNEPRAAAKVVELLAAGRSVALISDAGTPAVSDPGALIVRAVRAAGFNVVPVPGPNAAVTALCAAGFEGAFHFAGFLPPRSAARRTALRELKDLPATLVLYEAPHRIVELAQDLAIEFEGQRTLVIARELTKHFETIHATTVVDALAWLEADANRRRGEFVVLVGRAPAKAEAVDAEARRVLALLLAELPVRQAAKLAAAITGAPKNALYEQALVLKNSG